LNYGRALENLPDDKILARLKDWNCEWLARPNMPISEMASTLKDNMDTILAYRGTVFTEDFVDQLQGFITPMMGPLQWLDNKDRATNDPPTQDDVLDVLEGINGNDEVEHLFVDAFNTCGPVLMMAIHVMAINTLLHNPPEFANQTLRCTATEEFKANPSDDNMMKYLLDSILMRRRSVQRTWSLWDRSRYQRDSEEDGSERPSRSGQRLDRREGEPGGRRRTVTTSTTPRSQFRPTATSTTPSGVRRTSTPSRSASLLSWSTTTITQESTNEEDLEETPPTADPTPWRRRPRVPHGERLRRRIRGELPSDDDDEEEEEPHYTPSGEGVEIALPPPPGPTRPNRVVIEDEDDRATMTVLQRRRRSIRKSAGGKRSSLFKKRKRRGMQTKNTRKRRGRNKPIETFFAYFVIFSMFTKRLLKWFLAMENLCGLPY